MRLDQCLVARGLADSRHRAQRMVKNGEVRINGTVVTKLSKDVLETDRLEVTAVERYASHGGLKLEGALVAFQISVEGLECLDVGISTGGFTDCLLQHGAARVVGVDVGHDQLVEKLRSDPRIELREGINARALEPAMFERLLPMVVVDVSFIALLKVLPAVIDLVLPEGRVVALIKPQFELGRERVPRTGVVQDPVMQQAAVEEVSAWWRSRPGWKVRGVIPSPVRGGDGNQEFLVCAQKSDA
jgi:23S rRNA (cytidine1920-2'-O)/16S rRNA (cytidine1409-2'-O)-methyltransferase